MAQFTQRLQKSSTPTAKRVVDINTDYGQSRDKDVFQQPDMKLLDNVSSVNIPCCVHDGDPLDILEKIQNAKSRNIGVGAHIAYPDPQQGGYEEISMPTEELKAWIYVQLGIFQALSKASGLDIEHVRPHGALYRKFLTDPETARAVAEAVYTINPWLFLIGPTGPILTDIQESVGIRTVSEVYLGKRYSPEGTLIPEKLHETLPPQGILDQAKQLVNEGVITSEDGKSTPITFSTLHLSPHIKGCSPLSERLVEIVGKPQPIAIEAVTVSGWV